MTFHSLYRLEQRGLLDCPIVGVAFDDWTLDQLVAARARLDRRHRREARRGGVRRGSRSGSRTSTATSRTTRPTREVAEAIEGAKTPVFYLEVPPSLFGTVVGGLAKAGVTANARVVVEKPFGHDHGVGARARRRAAPVHRRVAAAPHRPLPREDGDRGDPLPPLREHDARAGLEPELRRVASRSRWPRTSASRTAATSTTRSARCATSSSTTSCRSSAMTAMEPPAGGDAKTLQDAKVALFRAISPADPAHYVRGQYDGYLGDRRRRSGLDDRDVRGAAPRHRQLALVGRAVLHPHRASGCRSRRPRSGSSSSTRRGSASRRSTAGRSRTSS